MLAGTVTALLDAQVAAESHGAVVVASERFIDQDGSPAVLIIRKSDGGMDMASPTWPRSATAFQSCTLTD